MLLTRLQQAHHGAGPRQIGKDGRQRAVLPFVSVKGSASRPASTTPVSSMHTPPPSPAAALRCSVHSCSHSCHLSMQDCKR